MKICENCFKTHDGLYGSGRFCCVKCARGFSTKEKRIEINKRVSKTLKSKLKRKPKYKKICKFCNSHFETHSKKIKHCSITCANKSRRINYLEREIYKQQCQFKFNIYDFPELFNLKLIEEYGWYKAKNRGNNLNGISRDHKISISYGFKNKIKPEIMSHPLNCELMKHSKNNKKKTKCSIDIETLIYNIETWNKQER